MTSDPVNNPAAASEPTPTKSATGTAAPNLEAQASHGHDAGGSSPSSQPPEASGASAANEPRYPTPPQPRMKIGSQRPSSALGSPRPASPLHAVVPQIAASLPVQPIHAPVAADASPTPNPLAAPAASAAPAAAALHLHAAPNPTAANPTAANPTAAIPTAAIPTAAIPTAAIPTAAADVSAGAPPTSAPGQAPPSDRGARGRRDRPGKGKEKPSLDEPRPEKRIAVPSIRAELTPDMEAELEAALGGMSLEDVLKPTPSTAGEDLELDSRHRARVVRTHRDNVFVELGGANQGILSIQQFPEPPAEGAIIEVIVGAFDADEGLYQLSIPGSAVAVENWSSVQEGMLVEARISGHNKGGLECDVNHLRGFIPASQIAAYRIEDFSQFVGEKMVCLITEANPEKRNLVLSRRAVLDRERAEAKEQLQKELAEGQTRDGVVRSLQDFGAFVDLGGVDGLVHISQLSWQRVQHPSEVLQVGQPVKVKIRKIDPQTGKISLSLRELAESPWTNVSQKYPVTSRVTGTVTRTMEFGAFVQLEPGVEGMIHVSELAHGRVWRASDVVKEGQEVEVKVLSVDQEQQRIGLSLKALLARPDAVKKPAEPEPEEEPAPLPPSKRTTPLKGGTGKASGGEQFGLKW